MFNYKGKILKVLVLGSTGLIGRTFLRVLSEKSSLDVYGTVRSELSLQYFKGISLSKIFTEIDIADDSKMLDIFGYFSLNFYLLGEDVVTEF